MKYEVHRVEEFENRNHPQVMLWFVGPEQFAGEQYLREIEHIAAESPFDLVILTYREGPPLYRDGELFYYHDKMHPIFQKLVARGKELGVRVGLHLLPNEFHTPDEAASALAVEDECVLDADGRARVTAAARGASMRSSFRSELLRVYLFRKTVDGFYQEGTLIDVTDKYVKATVPNEYTVEVCIEAPKEYAGYSGYVLTANYYRYPDPFSDFQLQSYGETMERYGDIGFGAMALDEYGYLYREVPWERKEDTPPVRERNYGAAMARFYREQTGQEIERRLFDMRYAPVGKPQERMRAINEYFEVHRQGPLRVERFFFEKAKQTFGPETFVGVHNTAHNKLTNDEVWRTGVDWWEIPREYGMTDENIAYPVRTGVACAAPKDLWYDMYYTRDSEAYYVKALLDARYGGRIHYHAYSDGEWGHDLSDPEFLRDLMPVEKKMRLLNWFNPPLPEMDLLIVFGYAAQMNWYPQADARNEYDINGKLFIQEKAEEIWDAGYVCALASSHMVDQGKITVDHDGRPAFNGRKFKALLYLYPQYSKEMTIQFLEEYTRKGGLLMIEGTATHDFEGNDVRARFERIYERAMFDAYALKDLERLGVRKNAVKDGCRASDGSVVLTDLESIRTGKPKAFSLEIDGDKYEGNYIGLMAILVKGKRGLKKLACGGFQELRRNGEIVLRLEERADACAEMREDGTMDVYVGGRSREIEGKVRGVE